MREFFTPYSYCGSDPVNYVDWMGLDATYTYEFNEYGFFTIQEDGRRHFTLYITIVSAPIPNAPIPISRFSDFNPMSKPTEPENRTGDKGNLSGGRKGSSVGRGSGSGNSENGSSSNGSHKKKKAEERGESSNRMLDTAVEVGGNTIEILEYADDVAPSVFELPNWMKFLGPLFQAFDITIGFKEIIKEATDPAAQSFYGGFDNPASQFLMYGYPDSIKTDPVKQKKYLQGLYK